MCKNEGPPQRSGGPFFVRRAVGARRVWRQVVSGSVGVVVTGVVMIVVMPVAHRGAFGALFGEHHVAEGAAGGAVVGDGVVHRAHVAVVNAFGDLLGLDGGIELGAFGADFDHGELFAFFGFSGRGRLFDGGFFGFCRGFGLGGDFTFGFGGDFGFALAGDERDGEGGEEDEVFEHRMCLGNG